MALTLSRALMVVELLLLALCLPGVVFTSMMFVKGLALTPWSLRLLITGVVAAAAWAAIFFQGVGYARDGDLLSGALAHWARLTGVVGLIPAALAMVYWVVHPPPHGSAVDGLFLIAALAWIPMVHLEVVRLRRRRSNHRWSGP